MDRQKQVWIKLEISLLTSPCFHLLAFVLCCFGCLLAQFVHYIENLYLITTKPFFWFELPMIFHPYFERFSMLKFGCPLCVCVRVLLLLPCSSKLGEF